MMGLGVVSLVIGMILLAGLVAKSNGEAGRAELEEARTTEEVGTLEGVVFDGFDGTGPTTLGSFRGKPMVVNFFASWCPPCAEEMPAFEEVHQELKGEVHFLGVDREDNVAAAKSLIEKTGVTYRIASDPESKMFYRMGGLGMPTTFFISAEGRLLERHSGPLTREELRKKVSGHFSI